MRPGILPTCIILAQTLAFLVFYSRGWLEGTYHTAGQETLRKLSNEMEQETSCNLSRVFQQWRLRIPEIISAKLPLTDAPSGDSPFVFFHCRKAGGSTWRGILAKAAKALALPSWIACEGGIPCRSYNIPVRGKYSIYGGHLYFADVLNVQGFSGDANRAKKAKETAPFDCIVSLRPTVSRVVSCWNFRFRGGVLHDFAWASNMTSEQWGTMLPNAYSREREGCNNEFVRVFGDITNEVRVNTLSTAALQSQQQCMAAALELDVIMSRMSQCIITINGKYEENLAVIQHYAPWLVPFYLENGNKKVNALKGDVDSSKQLQPGAVKVILEQNAIDEYVYQFGLALYEKQLEVAYTSKERRLI